MISLYFYHTAQRVIEKKKYNEEWKIMNTVFSRIEPHTPRAGWVPGTGPDPICRFHSFGNFRNRVEIRVKNYPEPNRISVPDPGNFSNFWGFLRMFRIFFRFTMEIDRIFT